MALSEGPFGSYANVTNTVSAAAKSEIIANIDAFIALLPDSSTGAPGATPDFDVLRPELERVLRAELDAVKAAINAAP